MLYAKASLFNPHQLDAYSNAYIGISLNSHNHNGEALEAIVEWINSIPYFTNLRIGLSDTLDRYNSMVENKMDEYSAHELCLKKGNAWLSKNAQIMEQIKIPYEIIRWDHWNSHYTAKINQYREFFTKLYFNDRILNHAVNTDIENFCKRRYGQPLGEMSTIIVTHSLRYLIEELTVYSVLYENYGNCACIYPGKELMCMNVIRSGLVQGIPNTIELSKFIRLSIHGREDSDASSIAA